MNERANGRTNAYIKWMFEGNKRKEASKDSENDLWAVKEIHRLDLSRKRIYFGIRLHREVNRLLFYPRKTFIFRQNYFRNNCQSLIDENMTSWKMNGEKCCGLQWHRERYNRHSCQMAKTKNAMPGYHALATIWCLRKECSLLVSVHLAHSALSLTSCSTNIPYTVALGFGACVECR